MTVNKIIFLTLLASALSTGCHRNHASPKETQVVYETPPPPEGTEKYCWQEPKVVNEKNGPGVDEQGHWYHPPYNAVREVKMGRWVPCAKGVN